MNSTTRIAAIAAPLLIAAAASAPAQAVIAGPQTSITSRTMAEGTSVIVTAKGSCPTFAYCDYRLETSSGTATENVDFTSVDKNRRVRKTSRKVPIKIRVTVYADGACEPTETFKATLIGTGAGDDDSFITEGTQTIPDADCNKPQPAPAPAQPAPAPAPAQPAPSQPAPAPAPTQPTQPTVPADSGSPEVTTTTTSNGVIKSCKTPMWTGQKGAFGAQGYYNSGCTVELTCPVTARVCQASGEGANNSEVNRDEHVTLNSRLRAFSASHTQFWFRDQSCAGTAWCRTEDMVMIRGGESISNQCNGVRAEAAQANRTSVRCTINVEVQY